jgi:hypothetical protein
MIPLEDKIRYHENRTCLGCGCEPEVVAYYHRAGKICGYQCTCGAIVIDDMYQGSSPNY